MRNALRTLHFWPALLERDSHPLEYTTLPSRTDPIDFLKLDSLSFSLVNNKVKFIFRCTGLICRSQQYN